MFQERNAAIKSRQYSFRVEVLPSQLLSTFFTEQSKYDKVYVRANGLDSAQNSYLNVSVGLSQ